MVYLPSTLAGLGEFAEAMSFNNPYMGFTHCVCLSWYPLKELKSITPLVSGFSMNDQVQISLPVNNKTRPKKKKRKSEILLWTYVSSHLNLPSPSNPRVHSHRYDAYGRFIQVAFA